MPDPAPDPMTPGRYLRDCRVRLGLSIEDLALRTETLPPVCVRRRADYLEAIERDIGVLSLRTAIALHPVLGFDPDRLDMLMADHEAASLRAAFPSISVERLEFIEHPGRRTAAA